jgi:hypothetical protein
MRWRIVHSLDGDNGSLFCHAPATSRPIQANLLFKLPFIAFLKLFSLSEQRRKQTRQMIRYKCTAVKQQSPGKLPGLGGSCCGFLLSGKCQKSGE